MPRCRSPDFTTLFLFRTQCVTCPRHQPSIWTLIRQIEALGYEVVILPREIEWVDIPREYWGVAVSIPDSHTLLFIVPLSRRCRRLMRSGIFLSSYEDG